MPGDLDPLSFTEAQLQCLYAERIAPLLQAQEAGRATAMQAYRMRLVLTALASLAVAGIAWAWYHDWVAVVVWGGITALSGRLMARYPLAEFAGQAKEPVLAAIAEAIGCTYTHSDFEREGSERLEELQLLPYHERSTYRDCFRGTHKGCRYSFYDGHLERRQKEWVTEFRGQLISIAFPKRFLGTTVVRRDAGILNAVDHLKSAMHRVNLGDTRLEKAFEVYATDQVEARDLIHPVFMERLLALETAFKGERLRCAFVDGLLLVAVEGGDKFELGSMHTELDDIARVRTIVADIAEVLRLIDSVLTAEQSVLPNP